MSSTQLAGGSVPGNSPETGARRPAPVAPFAVQAGEGTALREDELWYVIDGDFRFKAGGAMLRASTGGMAFGPRGTPHAFQNVG